MALGLFRRRKDAAPIDRLHGEIVAATRQPALYEAYGVADTFEGRFEILALVSSLVVRRLMHFQPDGATMGQDLTDRLFERLDDDLRELGVSDIAVPKRMKKLAAGLLGRRAAYDAALSAGSDEQLAECLARNIHNGRLAASDPRTARLARYTRAVEGALAEAPIEAFSRGPAPLLAAASIL